MPTVRTYWSELRVLDPLLLDNMTSAEDSVTYASQAILSPGVLSWQQASTTRSFSVTKRSSTPENGVDGAMVLSQQQAVPNITSISVSSYGNQMEPQESIPGSRPSRHTVQTVISVTSRSVVPKSQVLYTPTVLNQRTKRWLTLAEAVQSRVVDLDQSQYHDSATGDTLSLPAAVQRGFLDRDVLHVLHQKCGMRDVTSGHEVSLLQAIQKGLFNPVSGRVTEPQSGRTMSVNDACKERIISRDTADRLSYMTIYMTSTMQMQGYYGLTSATDVQLPLSLDRAIRKGLYDAHSGKVHDPVSHEDLTLAEALQRNLISAIHKEVVHPVSGSRLTVSKAVSLGIIDPRTGRFIDPQSGQQMSLDEAHQRGLLQAPMSLCTALTDGVVDYTGRFKDGRTGRKMTLAEAIEKSLLDEDLKCILDPKTNDLLSLSEAIASGMIDAKQGRFVDASTGLSLVIHEAVNEGLCQLLATDVVCSDRGISDTITNQKLTLNEAVVRGFLDTSTSCYIDKRTGKKLTIRDATHQGFVDNSMLTSLSAESGLHDSMGNGLSVLDALTRSLVNLKTGHVTDPVTGRRMAMDEAITIGVLCAEKAQNLVRITSPMIYTTSIVTEIRPSSMTERPLETMTIQQAVAMRLINEDTNTFTDPQSQRTMSLEDAISMGYLTLGSSQLDSRLESVMEVQVCIQLYTRQEG